jgi:adenylate cyclase
MECAMTDDQVTTISELRQLKTLLEEVDVSLRSQREILKQRNMNLPPMVLQTLKGVKADLDGLENILVEEQTELGQLRSLADTTAMINSSLDLDEVLTQAMDVVISLTKAERGYIILKNPETEELEFRIARDIEIGARRSSGTPQISQSIVNDVLETGEGLLADNAYKDERLQGNLSVANLVLRSVLCVPLTYRERVTGVVYVDNRLQSGVFTSREKNLLDAFANQAVVAIENARLYANLQFTLAEITQIKELMSNVFASIGSGVITTDDTDKVVTFNRAAAYILEHVEVEAIGKRIRSLLPLINADLQEYLEKVRDAKQSEYLDAEMEVVIRGRIALSMKLSPLQGSRHPQGVTVVLDDLTEQREREEMLDIVRRYLPPQLVQNIGSISQLGLGGERREVTCMFVDVMPMAAFRHLRPQQLMEMLNHYLATATDTIHAAEGIIDKYMGNEIMGIFNSQLNPMENHSIQAVEAGLVMRDAFQKLYAQLGIDPDPPFYRIGLHTGVATLGNVGSLSRRDFSAIGDTINLSHRLLENAQESQIFLSEDTRQHIEANANGQALPFRFEERGAIQVKGRAKEVYIYEVFRA